MPEDLKANIEKEGGYIGKKEYGPGKPLSGETVREHSAPKPEAKSETTAPAPKQTEQQ
ncbi:MAG: hypothetical protein P8Y36_09265 [Alphaproteobacteria bacterium]